MPGFGNSEVTGEFSSILVYSNDRGYLHKGKPREKFPAQVIGSTHSVKRHQFATHFLQCTILE